MAECVLPKHETRVRFPLPAPIIMNILIITPGKKHGPHLAELIAEYERRLSGAPGGGHRYDIEWRFLSPDTLTEESAAILKILAKGDQVILLDERGKMVTSKGLADLIQASIADGSVKRLVFIIGGAYGVDENVKKAVRQTISLSGLTLPHRLVRLLLVEQIYRAAEISRGGKYHHE